MLGHVVAQKKTRGRRKARASLVPPPTPKSSQQKAQVTTASKAQVAGDKMAQKPQTRRTTRTTTRKAVQDVSNHKITEFFPVRRSNRKTGKQLEEEKMDALADAIYNGTNESSLIIYTDKVKGRGIKAGRLFLKNEFVVEYKGEMMEYSEAKALEDKYSQDHSIGSYMYFFTHKNKRWCVDATRESDYKGRLINHSFLRPNLRTKVVEFDGLHHLILVAKRDIEEGEELLYDYGDRSPDTIAKNPWLMTT